jgi:hypothetical protein
MVSFAASLLPDHERDLRLARAAMQRLQAAHDALVVANIRLEGRLDAAGQEIAQVREAYRHLERALELSDRRSCAE